MKQIYKYLCANECSKSARLIADVSIITPNLYTLYTSANINIQDDSWRANSAALFIVKRQTRKMTLAVRDTGVSRHNGGKLTAPLTPQYNIVVMFKGFQGPP